MRILLVCYEYPPIGGGGGVGAKQYAKAWASNGHEVTVLTSGTSRVSRVCDESGVRVVRVATVGKPDRATSSMLSMVSYLVVGAFHLFVNQRTLTDLDIVNTHFSLPTGPLGLLAARILGVPQVLTIIGGDIYDPARKNSPHRSGVLRMVNRYLIAAADRVIAISSDTEKRARQHYGVERPIRVINYGFEPLKKPEEAPRVSDMVGRDLSEEELGKLFHLISVGRLVARKGFAYLIRALAQLPKEVRLLLVGDGPLEEELRHVAIEAGVEDRIRWLGYQPREMVYGYLKLADCFVLASLHEGLGIVVQEAMYAGLPIVATNNGGQVDLVEAPRNGLLVEPERPGALAVAIESIRTDPALAKAMGRNNREDILEYDVVNKSEEYLQVFRDALSERVGNSEG